MRPGWPAAAVTAGAVATALAAFYYESGPPLAGDTFVHLSVRPVGVPAPPREETHQERLDRLHRTRAVPVAFAAALATGLVGGVGVRSRGRYPWWAIIGSLAGAVGFVAAWAVMPCGCEVCEHRDGSAAKWVGPAVYGGVLGLFVGTVAASGWYRLTRDPG